MLFQQVSDEIGNVQPLQTMIGTNAEDFIVSEILTLSSGVLELAAVTNAGTQQYICMNKVTGATGVANVIVQQLRTTQKFAVTSEATVDATMIGAVVTLSTAGTAITATETAGVFQIDSTDGATTTSEVVGHFVNTLSDVL